jgi:hypothetical protein
MWNMASTLVIPQAAAKSWLKCLRLLVKVRIIIKDHRTPDFRYTGGGVTKEGMTKTTITINGRTYDAITGMPVVDEHHTAAHPAAPAAPIAAPVTKPQRSFSDVNPMQPAATPAKPIHHAHAPAQAVHNLTQKSQTLHRKAVKKPVIEPTQAHATTQRSPLISRFNQEAVQTETPAHHAPEPIKPAAIHPSVAKVMQQQAHSQAAPQLSGTDLKEQLIKERLAEVSDSPAHKNKKANWLSRQPRLVTILSSTLALLILGGYLTYITLPSISLKVAASRAGVNASMPEYKPDGYSLDGPITYSPGEVVISYKSNTNDDSGYKLTQKASNWDSQAVLDNYVSRLTDNYLTFQEKGVTVYTFGNKAAWVNGGLLYTIDGNAALSSDQILRVATSI